MLIPVLALLYILVNYTFCNIDFMVSLREVLPYVWYGHCFFFGLGTVLLTFGGTASIFGMVFSKHDKAEYTILFLSTIYYLFFTVIMYALVLGGLRLITKGLDDPENINIFFGVLLYVVGLSYGKVSSHVGS